MLLVTFATILPLAALLTASGAAVQFARAGQRPWMIVVLPLLLLMAIHQGLELSEFLMGDAITSSPVREIPETLVNLGASALVGYTGFIEARLSVVRRERDKLSAADEAKNRFLSSMSHELRTPLNAILGFSEVIRDQALGANTDTYAHYARYIHRSAQHLHDMVNNVLDAGHLERDTYTLSESRVDVRDVLDTATTVVQPLADEHGVNLEKHAENDLPTVHADALALRKIVINLTSNAIKVSSPNQRVTLTATGGTNGLEIAVADDGPGIPEDDIDRILRPFERGQENQAKHATGGAGLGLAISHELAKKHDGTLTLDSTPGIGTVARLWLPPERIQSSNVETASA